MNRLKSFYRRELFYPSFLSVFINPYYIVRKRLLQVIRKLSHNMHGEFIDFGCGAMPYREIFTVENYRGLDVKTSGHDSSSMHKDVIYYNGKKLPLKDSSVDSVFASEVFEHIFELDSTLMELNRILKPGGKLLITVPFVWEEHEIPYDFARYSSYGLKHLLQKNNFYMIESLKSGSSIETCIQLTAGAVHSILPTNFVLRLFLTILFISPLNLISLVLNLIFPKRDKLYLNNVILARKNAAT